ncbi:hypothetical protein L6452_25127 [Arctium lappa]|uniref:Uncharacterized protein n=1 Tax=Arctium lappa TaxID=4217 RepID=A0ACB9A9V9_ARCLA|nr:hypothetical protein L6452_25127 [Arctium lappa]
MKMMIMLLLIVVIVVDYGDEMAMMNCLDIILVDSPSVGGDEGDLQNLKNLKVAKLGKSIVIGELEDLVTIEGICRRCLKVGLTEIKGGKKRWGGGEWEAIGRREGVDRDLRDEGHDEL